MSGVSIGQAISIIGGSPILKNVLGHTVDKLKIPRHIDVGNVPGMSDIMSKIMSGGIGSLLQSPLASVLSPLTSALATAQASITSALGPDGAALVGALGNLSSSASNLSGLADNIVGLASNAGLPTAFDVIGHMNLAQSIGSALPDAMSLATVLAPTGSAPLLTSALNTVQPIVSQAAAGTLAVPDAVAAVAAIQASLDTVTTGSTNAVSTLQAMVPLLSAGQSTVALLVAGSPEMVAAIKTAIRPDMMAAVQAVVDAHTAIIAVSAESQAAAADAIASIVAAQAANAAQAPS